MNIAEFLMVYFFPLQMTVGLIGNFFNLIVLLSKGMRSKTNSILAIMALADILFLIFMVPHTLMMNEVLMQISVIRRFMNKIHFPITGVVNMCSFVSAWLIVIVSIERATAVIWPLKARNFWTSSMLFFLVVAIWVSAIFLSLHYHITHEVITLTKPVKIKNHTTGQEKIETRPVIQHQIKEGMEQYWNIAILSEMIALVFVPVLLVLGSNTLMIIALRRQNREHDVHIKRQRRATLIVVIIASTFTISQMPSAIIHLISLIYPKIKNEEKFRIAAVLTNSLVVMGKTANFFLFCTWSSYFRKNLNRVISMKMPCLYHFCEKGMTRFRSNSSLGDSNNHRMSKIRLQRFKSAPANTEYHFCIDNLKPNNSFPLNAKKSFRTTEKTLEETQIDETSTFIVNNNNKEHRLPLFTDL